MTNATNNTDPLADAIRVAFADAADVGRANLNAIIQARSDRIASNVSGVFAERSAKLEGNMKTMFADQVEWLSNQKAPDLT
jgi:hypothetical protein